jgi:hypothetical protein
LILTLFLSQNCRQSASPPIFDRDARQPNAEAFQRIMPQHVPGERIEAEDLATTSGEDSPATSTIKPKTEAAPRLPVPTLKSKLNAPSVNPSWKCDPAAKAAITAPSTASRLMSSNNFTFWLFLRL